MKTPGSFRARLSALRAPHSVNETLPVPRFALRVWALCLLQSVFCLSAAAQPNSFTYQGRLDDASGPANGLFDFQFALYPASFGTNNQVDTTITQQFLPVSNGLFTVQLTFPMAGNFDGSDRWLEIAVRPAGLATNYVTLAPRQQITSAPYALTAQRVTGSVTAGQLTGVLGGTNLGGTYSGAVAFTNTANTFTGNGGGLTNVNAATLGGLTSAGFWRTNGNTGANPNNGAFLGTTDDQPLEFKVNARRALRLEAVSDTNFAAVVNVIGGSMSNRLINAAKGATISGGGAGYAGDENIVGGDLGTVGGGRGNSALASEATVAGGRANTAGGTFNSTVSGGYANSAMADYSVVSGGVGNAAGGEDSNVGGGRGNVISSNGWRGTVSGGVFNTVDATEGTVGGGGFNSARAYSATIGGGGGNAASGEWSTIAGGRDNLLTNAHYATIGGGRLHAIESNAWDAVIAGGIANRIEADAADATIGGGWENRIGSGSLGATIPGGVSNTVTAP